MPQSNAKRDDILDKHFLSYKEAQKYSSKKGGNGGD